MQSNATPTTHQPPHRYPRRSRRQHRECATITATSTSASRVERMKGMAIRVTDPTMFAQSAVSTSQPGVPGASVTFNP